MKNRMFFCNFPNMPGGAARILRFLLLLCCILSLSVNVRAQRKAGSNTPVTVSPNDQVVERFYNSCMISTPNGYKVKPGYRFVRGADGKAYVALNANKKPKNQQSVLTIKTQTPGGIVDASVIIEVWCECADYAAGGACTMEIEGDRIRCTSNLDANDPCTRCEKHRKILIPNPGQF